MFGGPSGGTRSQDNGRFDIDDVAAGSYRLNGSIPVFMNGGGRGGFAGRGAVTTGGYVTSTWSSSTSGGPGSTDSSVEVAVTDADVKDVRVTVHRQTPQ